MTPKQTIESVYDAFNRGDIPHIVGLVAPNAVWRQSKRVPWGGAYSGPAGASEFFTKLDAAAETTEFTPRESVEVGNQVFSFGSYSCKLKSTGKPASMEWMFRWRVENGKITLFDSYIDSAAITEAMH